MYIQRIMSHCNAFKQKSQQIGSVVIACKQFQTFYTIFGARFEILQTLQRRGWLILALPEKASEV